MEGRRKLLVSRIITAGIIAVIVAAFAFVLIRNPYENEILPCWYYTHLGFKCPSCGATRAAYSIATFDFATAFHYHAYYTATAPMLIYFGAALTLWGFTGKAVLPLPKKTWWIYLIAYFSGLTLFGVVRNFIPAIY